MLIHIAMAMTSLSLNVKPRIGARVRLSLEGRTPVTPGMDYIGMRAGSLFVYKVRGEETGYGFFRDSVLIVFNLDTTHFGFCTYPSPQRYLVAAVEHLNFTDSTIVGDSLTPERLDSILNNDEDVRRAVFVYVKDTTPGFAPYTYDGIRFLVRGAAVGDTWSVLDTCVFGPFMRYDTVSDIDGDGEVDSVRMVQAQARIVSSGALIRTVTPIISRLKFTRGIVDSSYGIVVDSIDLQDSTRWAIAPDTGIVSITHPPLSIRFYYHPFSQDTTYAFDTVDSDVRLVALLGPRPSSPPSVVSLSPPSGSSVPPNTHVFVRFSHPMDPRTIQDTLMWVNGSFRDIYFVISPDTLNPLTGYHFFPSPPFGSSSTVKFKASSRLKDLWGDSLYPEDSTVFTTGSSADLVPPTVKVLLDSDTTDLDTLLLYQPYADTVPVYVSDVPLAPGIADAWVENSSGNRVMTLTPCDGSSSYSNPDTVCGTVESTRLPQGTYRFFALARDYAGNVGKDSFFVRIVDTLSPYIVSTFPNDSATGVSNSTHIQITFNEPMDRNYFRPHSVVLRYGSTTVDSSGYSRFWATGRSLIIYPQAPFPYQETVWVFVDSLRDQVGNSVRRDSFFFVTQNKEDVLIDFVEVFPDSVFRGDSVMVVAQASSGFPIRGGMFYLDGAPYDSARAGDGAFDENVETLTVYIRTDSLSEGEHTVSVEAFNDYTTSSRATVTFRVLRKPALLERDNVLVYPNPVRGQGMVRIKVGDGGGAEVKVEVEVWNMRARRVFRKEVSVPALSTVEIPLPSLPPDMYLLRVRAGDRKVEKWFGVVR